MPRSFTFILLLVVCFVCLGPLAAQDEPTPEPVGLRPDAPEYALHGPYWVGTREISAPDVQTGLRFWYPALNPQGLAEQNTYEVVTHYPDTPTESGQALDDAAPNQEQGPYPLVVFMHGTGDYRLEMAYLAEHLASYGFVVMAADYRDWVFSDNSLGEVPAGLYGRPALTTALMDYAQTIPSLRGMIDAEQVAVLGAFAWSRQRAQYGRRATNMDWYSRIAEDHSQVVHHRTVG